MGFRRLHLVHGNRVAIWHPEIGMKAPFVRFLDVDTAALGARLGVARAIYPGRRLPYGILSAPSPLGTGALESL